MKIGIIIPGGVDRSGEERIIPFLLAFIALLARRHEVHVYALNQYPQAEDYPLLGAHIHNIGYRPGRRRFGYQLVRTMKALHAEERNRPFDILHGFWAGETGFIAALAARNAGIPCVVSVCGGEFVALPDIGYGGQLDRRQRFLISVTLRMAHRVTAGSHFMEKMGRPFRSDIQYLPFGISTHAFFPADHDPAGLPWRLIHIASLNRVKDQPMLLSAFQQIRASEPNVHLDIVGEDTLNGEMQRLARKLGLEQAVTFHGFQKSPVVRQMLQESHLLLLSSRHEAAAMVVLEAGACGIPTVSTSVGYPHDMSPLAAATVPVSDSAAMAQVTLALLRDDALRHALGHQAREYTLTYDADWSVEQIELLYTELIRHQNKGLSAPAA